jgi:hypothetical protein
MSKGQTSSVKAKKEKDKTGFHQFHALYNEALYSILCFNDKLNQWLFKKVTSNNDEIKMFKTN